MVVNDKLRVGVSHWRTVPKNGNVSCVRVPRNGNANIHAFLFLYFLGTVTRSRSPERERKIRPRSQERERKIRPRSQERERKNRS